MANDKKKQNESDLVDGGVMCYFFYIFVGGTKLSDIRTVDGNGIISDGKHLFYTTEDDAYKAAWRRAKKYHKVNPDGKTRFYYMSDEIPKKMTCFDCYGNLYRDTLRPFMRMCIGHIRYRLMGIQ